MADYRAFLSLLQQSDGERGNSRSSKSPRVRGYRITLGNRGGALNVSCAGTGIGTPEQETELESLLKV